MINCARIMCMEGKTIHFFRESYNQKYHAWGIVGKCE
jgi:hypothetical protein